MPREADENRRTDGGHPELQQSMMPCLLKTISIMADVCEAIFSCPFVFISGS